MIHDSGITSELVPDDDRMEFLQRLFGACLMLDGEQLIYQMVGRLCDNFYGERWDFHQLSNGGGYLSPVRSSPLNIAVNSNGFTGSLSPDAAGIVATLFALTSLANSTDSDVMIDRVYELRSFAIDHPEAPAIFAAID